MGYAVLTISLLAMAVVFFLGGVRIRGEASTLNRLCIYLGYLQGVIFFCSSSHATMTVARTFEELVAGAEDILIGTVGDSHSYLLMTGDLVTIVSLQEVTYIEHMTHDTSPYRIQIGGGTIDGYTTEYEDMPKLNTGERVLVFLRNNGRSLSPFVGWDQGVFRITNEGDTDVVRASDHTPIVGLRPDGFLRGAPPEDQVSGFTPGLSPDGPLKVELVVSHQPSPSPLKLSEFVTLIRDIRSRTGFRPPEVNAPDPSSQDTPVRSSTTDYGLFP